ncbi:MAG: tetratricopeptide repeat protein [Pseudomonadales bacterium]|nr:tetratricopeptide repeat protein [Pseudomonadales bacterium]
MLSIRARRTTPIAVALLLGAMLGVASSSSIALLDEYPDPYVVDPNFVPGNQPHDKEVVYNPEFAPMYYNRGNAWYDQGEYLNAIRGYNNALFLKPDMEPGYFNRGISYFLLRQYKAAAEDFDNILQQNPNHTYAKIWKKVALLKYQAVSSEPAQPVKILEGDGKKNRVYKDWPSNVLAFVSGEMDEEAFIFTAFHPNASVQVQQYCELWFYVGQRHLAAGNRDQAIVAFKKSVETGVTDFAEYVAASNELK